MTVSRWRSFCQVADLTPPYATVVSMWLAVRIAAAALLIMIGFVAGVEKERATSRPPAVLVVTADEFTSLNRLCTFGASSIGPVDAAGDPAPGYRYETSGCVP